MWIILIIILVLLILLFLISFFAARFLVTIAVDRKNSWYRTTGHVMMNPSIAEKQDPTIDHREKEQIEEGNAYWDAYGEKCSITSKDGLKLFATLIKKHPESKKWVLMVHGYRSNGKVDTAFLTKKIGEMGYNTLSPDLRGHGESEGDFIGLGWPERKDNLLWIDYILSIDPNAEILLYGGSMGASCVMMTSGEKLPSNVKGMIADCGYTSADAEFTYILKSAFKLPKFPIIPIANLLAKGKTGYYLTDASSIKQLKKNKLPTLFIHGTKDKFVPHEMVYENMEASQGVKELLIVENAPHLSSFIYEPENYFSTINHFIKQYLS